MIPQPLGCLQGQSPDIEIHAQEILNIKARLNELLAYLAAHCCGGEPCEVVPAAGCTDC